MEKQRIAWIDYAKGLSMVAVILYHTQIPQPFKGFAYAVCLPVFFFLSGYTANTQDFESLKQFWRKRILRLLIPYLSFNCITYLFWLIIGRHYGLESAPISWWRPLLGIVYGNSTYLTHYAPLWFLSCLISLETLYFIIQRFSSQKIQVVTILAIFILMTIYTTLDLPLLPWGLCSSGILLPLFALGRYTKKRWSNLTFSVWSLGLITLISLSGLCFLYAYMPTFKISTATFGNYGLTYCHFCLTITFFIALSLLLDQMKYKLRLLSFIGRNSLVYLLTHLLVFTIIKGGAVYILHLPLEFFATFSGAISLWITTILLEIPIVYFILQYMPIAIWKK